MNKYKIGDIVKLKNGTICKIIDYYKQVLDEDKPYIVENNGVRLNMIVTNDMIAERIK